ncbi:LysR family transcriptional regulator [Acrocarpospora macrocephala]|uniref:LysR family transcriptional regulator n=1 Tax=Acrocarpospora macrocephala TaxID=150177 RepID=A0A5M3WBS9_9ACTN|nr:LysR substrate-binding domain-containing protein [Acrocarpospora macrocephala]GES06414.1 LysR family transcriptional regulator [Acrocarpospora macrocephala]
MELRQLRYFVTLAEELHFGRAAAREHIVQSALSQQVQRLERELGVRLLDRSTHHVDLTPAGAAFLIEARQILDHVNRAALAARNAVASSPTLRAGIIDASYDSMPQILREVQRSHPDFTIHQVEAGTPEQYRQLADGRLDIGIGRASQAPPEVASELIRLDPLGVLIPDDHRFAAQDGVPVAALADELLLLGEDGQTPELNQFVIELCRSAGFAPTIYEGTVESTRAAADLVLQHRCVHCIPSSSRTSNRPGTIWRPLTEPVTHYPWSLLWREGNPSPHLAAVLQDARGLAQRLGWLHPAGPTSPADAPAVIGQGEETV